VDLCLLTKITEGHIEENKMKKMKVSVAAQTLNSTPDSVLGDFAQWPFERIDRRD